MLTVLIPPHCVLQVRIVTLCSVDRCVSSGLIRQENNSVRPMSGVVFCPGDLVGSPVQACWVTIPILILQGASRDSESIHFGLSQPPSPFSCL
jgi:hypothetical protein